MATNPLFNSNRMKIGTFNTNTVNALTDDPENLRPRWSNIICAAKMADDFRFEAITPIARWKGYVDNQPDHYTNEIVEAFTFAAAVAQATRHSAIFATSHAPTIHPVAVAKMPATIDQISGGRFTLNIVAGWNRREFDMFGIDLLHHDERYVYLAEWLQLLRRLWTGEEFDYQSKYFRLKGALARPTPVQQGGLPIMNAATSAMGMEFAAQHSTIGFCSPRGDDISAWAEEIAAFKRIARDKFGRDIQIWTNVSITQRASRAEAMAHRERFTSELLDTAALDSLMGTICRENNWPPEDPKVPFMRARMQGGAGFPLVGSAQDIADDIERMADAGINGVLCTWVDYIDGIQRLGEEVLPILESRGLRAPAPL